jgi:hypothetical protein
VDRTLYQATSTVLAGTTASVIACGLVQSDGYFDLGTVAFTSGKNAGLSRSIKSYAAGSVTLTAPFPNVPQVGDTFTALPGCGKTLPVLSTGSQTYTIANPRTVAIAYFAADFGVTLKGQTHTLTATDPDTGLDYSYTVTDPDTAMVKVTGTPSTGQYTVTGGTYGFSSADIGRNVVISYQYASGNQTAQCFAIYGNTARFSGCPDVPVPETST